MVRNGMISNLLTEEQRKKVALREERLDSRGVFTRFRVDDQTVFDAFLFYDLIDRPSHEGLLCLVSDVEKSGAFPSGINFDAVSRTVSYKVGDAVSSRWMSFSYVYRHLERKGLSREANIILDLVPVSHSWRLRFTKDLLVSICKEISPALPVISQFYGCQGREDPRDIIRKKHFGRGNRGKSRKVNRSIHRKKI